MISPKDRAAVVAALKRHGAKARKGQLRIGVGDLFWYVGLRADGVGPQAAWLFEVGCWVPELTPEPEGGAVDCPLMLDVPGGDDVVATASALVDDVTVVGDLAALGQWAQRHPEALVDRVLRERLSDI